MSADDVTYVLNDASDEVRFHVPLNEGESIDLPELQELMLLVVGLAHCDIKVQDIHEAVNTAVDSFEHSFGSQRKGESPMSQRVTNVRITPVCGTIEVVVCSHTVEIRQIREGRTLSAPIITVTPKTGAVHVIRDQPYDIKIFHGDLDILEDSE